MVTKKTLNIADLVPDNCNFNDGTEKGKFLIEKSLKELGAGRSILLDKNNRIISGNKTIELAIKLGFKKVRIIDSDGKYLIAVLRTDVDLDSEKGRKLALADNATTQVDLSWNERRLIEMSKKYDIDLTSWKMKIAKMQADLDNKVQTIINEKKDLSLTFTPEEYVFVLSALRVYDDDFSVALLKALHINE